MPPISGSRWPHGRCSATAVEGFLQGTLEFVVGVGRVRGRVPHVILRLRCVTPRGNARAPMRAGEPRRQGSQNCAGLHRQGRSGRRCPPRTQNKKRSSPRRVRLPVRPHGPGWGRGARTGGDADASPTPRTSEYRTSKYMAKISHHTRRACVLAGHACAFQPVRAQQSPGRALKARPGHHACRAEAVSPPDRSGG